MNGISFRFGSTYGFMTFFEDVPSGLRKYGVSKFGTRTFTDDKYKIVPVYSDLFTGRDVETLGETMNPPFSLT